MKADDKFALCILIPATLYFAWTCGLKLLATAIMEALR